MCLINQCNHVFKFNWKIWYIVHKELFLSFVLTSISFSFYGFFSPQIGINLIFYPISLREWVLLLFWEEWVRENRMQCIFLPSHSIISTKTSKHQNGWNVPLNSISTHSFSSPKREVTIPILLVLGFKPGVFKCKKVCWFYKSFQENTILGHFKP